VPALSLATQQYVKSRVEFNKDLHKAAIIRISLHGIGRRHSVSLPVTDLTPAQ